MPPETNGHLDWIREFDLIFIGASRTSAWSADPENFCFGQRRRKSSSAGKRPMDADGLPPLPRSLRGTLSSSGGSWRDMQMMQSRRTRIQAEMSCRGGGEEAGVKPGGLDPALALLRRDMVGLRQLDMSLLCQLGSLHEAIQECKGEASLTADKGYSEEEEEEEDYLKGKNEDEAQNISQKSPRNSSYFH